MDIALNFIYNESGTGEVFNPRDYYGIISLMNLDIV